MTETLSVPPTPAVLPVQVTSFVGRRAELVRIRRLLSESRLVTLAGSGGIGKTRLAFRVAADLRRLFSDGVVLVSLGPLKDPDSLADQVAMSLGLHGHSSRAAPEAIIDYLQTRQVLLILDNCEHVVASAALTAEMLLRNCPEVRILSTSREPLRIQGEAVHRVAPLAVPPAGGEGGRDAPLQEFEAVTLFLDRARAIVPDFSVTEENRFAVAAICRKLEGIPLAIELACARLTAWSPVELDSHLGDRWALLNRGSRAAPHRQQTMADCIEWSFDLCTEAERQLWAETAVFADGFEFDAVSAVCSEPENEPIADTLSSLVDKSILVAVDHGGSTRFRICHRSSNGGSSNYERPAEQTSCSGVTATSTSLSSCVLITSGRAPLRWDG